MQKEEVCSFPAGAVLPERLWLRKVPTRSSCWYGAHVCLNEHTLTCYRHTPHPGIALKILTHKSVTLSLSTAWKSSLPLLFLLPFSPPKPAHFSASPSVLLRLVQPMWSVSVVGSLLGQLAVSTDWRWPVRSDNGNNSVNGTDQICMKPVVLSFLRCFFVFDCVQMCVYCGV